MVHRLLIRLRSIGFAVGELVAWSRGNRRRVRVFGASMEPTLHDGDQVLIKPVPVDDPAAGDEAWGRSIRIGSVVVFEHPDPARDLVLVKRLETILDTGGLVVVSDNRGDGTDSRSFGPIQRASLLGVATVKLHSLQPIPIGSGHTPKLERGV